MTHLFGDDDLLTAGLLHELRQPLTAMEAGLRLARAAGHDASGLDLVAEQLARLREMLRSYQDLMERREGSVPFGVGAVVAHAVRLLRHRLQPLGARFACDASAAAPMALGSPGALVQALANLLSNAIDALEESGSPGRLAVRVLPPSAPGGPVEVRVADEGVGVPPSLRPRLFEPRFTTKPPGRGSGIGLALARRMMGGCGGDVALVADDDPRRPAWARTEFAVLLPTVEETT